MGRVLLPGQPRTGHGKEPCRAESWDWIHHQTGFTRPDPYRMEGAQSAPNPPVGWEFQWIQPTGHKELRPMANVNSTLSRPKPTSSI